MSEYQIIFGWCGFGFGRMTGPWSMVYQWILRLGFVEIRKWNQGQIRIAMEKTEEAFR